jgi:hypothetical protein
MTNEEYKEFKRGKAEMCVERASVFTDPVMVDDYGWELVAGQGLRADTCRLRVPGGWIYRHRLGDGKGGPDTTVALCFVPDPRGAGAPMFTPELHDELWGE